MGEVFCIVKGDEKKLTQWVAAREDRYVVWVDGNVKTTHPRILTTEGHELALQQIALDFLYLPFVYDEPDHPILQKLARIQSEMNYRASDFADQGIKLLENFRANLQNPTKIAHDCFGKFSQFPAIVCGAGPSLKEAIPFLKEHRDAFLIIGCGAGLQALLAEGIEPHLTVHVDVDPHHKFPKTTIPFFYQLRTSHRVASQMKGPRFLMAGAGNFPLERWIEEKLNINDLSDGGWTAATCGAELAHHLGSPSIYFAGVDFSASQAIYAKGVKTPSQDNFTKITLANGEQLQTRSDWLFAAEWLSAWSRDKNCAILSKPNPLMPSIPAVELQTLKGVPGVASFSQSVFSACKETSGKEAWNEVTAHLTTCQNLVSEFLTHFQTIYPNPPLQDATCLSILGKINNELGVHLILDPIWACWEAILWRDVKGDPNALTIHRILLLKTVADRFYAH